MDGFETPQFVYDATRKRARSLSDAAGSSSESVAKRQQMVGQSSRAASFDHDITLDNVSAEAKRNRPIEPLLDTAESLRESTPEKQQMVEHSYRAASFDQSDSTLAAHMSMKQALLDQSAPSPPLHTEDEYAAMVPDSPASRQLDFSEEPNSFDLDFKDARPVPKFERTYTDIAADPFYDPGSVGVAVEYDSRDGPLRGNFAYSSISDNQIRLLRLAPGAWGEPVHCALKPVYLDSLARGKIAFQALSYAWGTDPPTEVVFLQDVSSDIGDFVTEEIFERVANRTRPKSFLVRVNLYNALKRYRHHKENKWFWIDAICIDQVNDAEKSRQIAHMPTIYSTAYNVAIWLGEATKEDSSAIAMIPKILNLRSFNTSLINKKPSNDVLRSWIAFSCLLQRDWFRRRWVIQEVACARRLAIRIGHHILSWVDFADSIELFSAHFILIEELYGASELAQYDPDALRDARSTGVLAIIELSRKAFRRTADPKVYTRLMDLQSLVLASATFAVSNVRDVIYALLHLANDAATWKIHADYSRPVLDVYADFVDYCLLKESSLDIICRTWAHWSPELTDESGTGCPSWVGLVPSSHGIRSSSVVRIDGESLVGQPCEKVYNASRGTEMQAKIMFRHHDIGAGQTSLHTDPRFSGLLVAKGIQIGRLSAVSSRVIEGTIAEDALGVLGWKGSLEHDVPDQLWRTLVANRGPYGKAAPSWYWRACALALTQSSIEGDLSTSRLLANKMQPWTVINFLKRVQAVVWSRRFFRCTSKTETVGFGPRTTMEGDIVCILFGCSVPVILRRVVQEGPREMYRLVGECYVHGYMEGEAFDGLVQESIEKMSLDYHIQ